MKLFGAETQYRIKFWAITVLFLLIFMPVLGLVLINPICRGQVFTWVAKQIDRACYWRDFTLLKKSWEKAHLFDLLKGPDNQ